jgi:hypothetical protein
MLYQEGTAIVNIDVPNVGTLIFIEQSLLNIKRQIDTNIIVCDFNIPLSPTDRSSRPKKKKNQQGNLEIK